MFRKTEHIRTRRTAWIFLLACSLIPGTVSMSVAYDVEIRSMSTATVSDNIGRKTSGLETDGYLLTTAADFNITGEVGSGTMDLVVGGGLEYYESDRVSNSSDYNFQLNLRFPWTTTGFVELSAGSGEGTEEPKVTDMDQSRVRTAKNTLGVKAGRGVTRTFKWETGVSTLTEERYDSDLKETSVNLKLDRRLSAISTLAFEATYGKGTEDVAQNKWTETLVTLGLSNRRTSLSSSGYRLEWETLDLTKGDGSNDLSNMISLVMHYTRETRKGWTYSSELGIDGIKPVVDDRFWEPRAELGLSSQRGRRIEFDSFLITKPFLQDPVDQADQEIAWSRDTQFQAVLKWHLSRTFLIEPIARYRYAQFNSYTVEDTIDRTVLFQLGCKWSFSKTWVLEVAAVTETIDSSDPLNSLAENSLRMNIGGQVY